VYISLRLYNECWNTWCKGSLALSVLFHYLVFNIGMYFATDSQSFGTPRGDVVFVVHSNSLLISTAKNKIWFASLRHSTPPCCAFCTSQCTTITGSETVTLSGTEHRVMSRSCYFRNSRYREKVLDSFPLHRYDMTEIDFDPRHGSGAKIERDALVLLYAMK
jgi:hypothetical protein